MLEKAWEINRTLGKLVPLTSKKTSDTVNATYLLEVIHPVGGVITAIRGYLRKY